MTTIFSTKYPNYRTGSFTTAHKTIIDQNNEISKNGPLFNSKPARDMTIASMYDMVNTNLQLTAQIAKKLNIKI